MPPGLGLTGQASRKARAGGRPAAAVPALALRLRSVDRPMRHSAPRPGCKEPRRSPRRALASRQTLKKRRQEPGLAGGPPGAPDLVPAQKSGSAARRRRPAVPGAEREPREGDRGGGKQASHPSRALSPRLPGLPLPHTPPSTLALTWGRKRAPGSPSRRGVGASAGAAMAARGALGAAAAGFRPYI